MSDNLYRVAIIYYRRTGKKIARHLKKGLEDTGTKTFLDDDIPSSVKSHSDEWREWIDKAILESNKIILIMTYGFNTRDEVIRELFYAWDKSKEVILCKDNNLPPTNMIVVKDGKRTDLGKLNYISFEDEEELLRKIGALLSGHELRAQRKKNQEESAENLLSALRAELEEIKGYIKPRVREFPTPYTPVWESAITSSQLLYLSKVARKELSSIYKKIDECGNSAGDTRIALEEHTAMNTFFATARKPNLQLDEDRRMVYQRHRFTIERHAKTADKLVEDIGKILEMAFWESS